VMHAYQVYKLAEQVLNGSENVDTSLALEVDGITNGMASTLMQVGLTEETRELLEKAGVYIGSSVKGHGEFIDNGGVDIYSTPIDGIQSAMVTGITDKVSTILGADSKDIEVLRNANSTREEYEAAEKRINKKWRNFMKGPVMIFIYGASMKNIRRAIARSLITGNSYIKGGMQSGKIAEIAELAGMRYEEKLDKSGKVVARVLIKGEKSYPLTYKKYNAEKGILERVSDTDVKNIVLEEWMIGMLTSAIEKNIGKAVEDSFKQAFGPAVKYRKALKTVNELKYVLSKVDLTDKLKGRKYHDLSKEELTEIKNRMRDEGTYYGSENPVGGMQDYFKEKDNLRDEVEPIQVKIHTKNFQSANGYAKLVNRILKEMGSNVGAIGVIDIHAVDGGVMIKGHRAKVLNLFDALILGLDPEVNKEQIQALNEAFYQINMEHSIVGKAVESTVNMMEKVDITKAMEIPGLASEIEEDLRRIQEADKDASVVELIHGMMESIEELKNIDTARRAMMETQGVQVNQYYGTDLVEAKAGDDVEVNKDGRWYVLDDKDVEVLQNGVAVVGEVMQSSYVKIIEEATSKAEDGTILAMKVEIGKLRTKKYPGMVHGAEYIQYSDGLINLIENSIGKVKEVDATSLTLEEIRAGILDELPPIATYSPVTNTISRKFMGVTKKVLQDAVEEGEVRKYINTIFGEETAEYIVDNSDMKALKKTVLESNPEAAAQIAENVDKLFQAIEDTDGKQIKLHEMIHAGSTVFMRENPDHPATKRVKALFELAKELVPAEQDNTNQYWRTNVDEFVAEGLSNPEVVAQLSKLTIKKTDGKLVTVYKVFVDTLMGMLGIKDKEATTVHSELLRSFTGMLEEQILKQHPPKVAERIKKEWEAMDNFKPTQKQIEEAKRILEGCMR
jgi:hypothetical protein